MQLTLRATRCPPGSPVSPVSFGAGGGSIGRSAECSLALPDPKRYISRVHAQIRCRDGVYSLKVLSKVNPVLVNNVPVGHNEAVEIKAGDSIILGDYEFVAALTEDSLFQTQAPAGASADPFAFLDSLSTHPVKPGEDTLQDPFFKQAAKPGTGGGLLAGLTPPPAQGGEDLLSGMLGTPAHDPLLDILQGRQPTADSGALATRPAQAPGRLPDADESTIDRFLSQGGMGNLDQGGRSRGKTSRPATGGLAPYSDHVHDLNLPFQPPRASPAPPPPAARPAAPEPAGGEEGGPGEPDIFADILGKAVESGAAAPTAAAPTAPTAPAPAPPLDEDIFAILEGLGVEQSGGAPAAPPPPAPAVSPGLAGLTPPGPSASGSAPDQEAVARLMASFAAGVGVGQLNVAPEDAEAFMEEVGRMLRASVEGIYTLLILRAEVKKELRAEDRTMIASRENNPLKHTESVDEALGYLLRVKDQNPAFLPPIQAIQDAYNDVRAHELAVMAGMRAGLSGVIKRFDPKALEPRIKKSGALDAVLPALYKAKLWETFVALYQDIEREAEDHFDKLFGREFVRAYMEQTKKLRKARK
ncbi:MAG: type VI secretion system-associated FHA domain protein TagH [Thiobacillaceae bacterium]|nr:type VI secretion system-associated FHA domain protein TagH [Thiobacillaceae bacterium]